jgi:HSP20 family molecular chaperone IbpA
MNRAPADIFEEMDEMFARMFCRMDREFMSGKPPAFGYRILIENGSPVSGMTEVQPIPARDFHESVVEVHQIGDETKVITELPGATEDAIRLDVKGNTLVIYAGDADNHYHTTAVLPPVDTDSMQKTYRHGVLEVTFRNAAEIPVCRESEKL